MLSFSTLHFVPEGQNQNFEVKRAHINSFPYKATNKRARYSIWPPWSDWDWIQSILRILMPGGINPGIMQIN